jgi:hypothetical protein
MPDDERHLDATHVPIVAVVDLLGQRPSGVAVVTSDAAADPTPVRLQLLRDSWIGRPLNAIVGFPSTFP